MKSKIIYITSFLLLLIFPITAVGLDLSVHKCRHSGNLHFSFFQLDSKKQFDDCCCKPGSKAETVSSPTEKTCSDIEYKESAKPENRPKEKKKEIKSANSCCSKTIKNTKKKPIIEITSKSQIVEPKKSQTAGKKITCEQEFSKSVTCCDISKVTFSLTSAPIIIITPEKTIKANVHIPHLTLISFMSYQNFDKSSKIRISNPLREPITKIISYISLQSNPKDDSDIHT